MRGRGHVLITGGAGFIGSNLADRLARAGERVLLLDDLSRPGVARNLAWLQAEHGDRIDLERADVRDAAAVARAAREATSVFHLAAQVAVTTSLEDPVGDFEVNARGTLNVLEAVRGRSEPPPLLFTSTNKVYGALEDLALVRNGDRYGPPAGSPYARGVSEARPVEFHSPYGCSKGAADQYVLEWARTFGVPAVVFRMSCIYGPHQHGNEDQGWVAHLLRAALRGDTVTIYGDGRQVRDVLFVEDLVDAFLLARGGARKLAGEAFNVGGGPDHTLSLLELVDLIEALDGERPKVTFSGWRVADQRWYVSDTSKLRAVTGWAPRVPVAEGIGRLHAWLRAAFPAPVGAALPEAQP
ncbi:SDR family NAD(P)-dependent oxidoreductase [Anaeromyxobacter sp. Fw109-5]|uniref:SDR family NAD(P)-dependent oxidoreductase n=1 Tax=Anaeromyxobacter sp. (strain Fw109-5) TaxID=404589 RepID=UPI0000ED8A60|nr:SDR family NAD(P)-dependent oxidoreductase [Anaeromyxobacter sp. Fw109-5]ABS27412.1 NAD-dependent epimerase/dehydratase [Anaeromyxobacter sp. Fw109-5]